MTVCHDAGQVLEALKQYPEEDIFIIGGGMVYREFLPYCNKAYVTCIHHVFEADTDFVDLDRTGEWEVTSTSTCRNTMGLPMNLKSIQGGRAYEHPCGGRPALGHWKKTDAVW